MLDILISVEEQETEVAVEKELTLYGLINNFDGLKEANAIEHHIQSEAYFEGKGKIRIRATRPDTGDEADTKYELTLKSSKDSSGSCNETTTTITKEFAEAFVRDASGFYVRKTRYTFFAKEPTSSITCNGVDYTYPSDILKVEIDVFMDKDNNYNSYCKIDIETQDFEEYMTKTYPDLVNANKVLRGSIDLSKLSPQITDIHNPKLDKDKDFIKKLWNQFNIKAQ